MVCFFSVKGRFSSSLGVMLSMLGSVVGTGNIWRFPRIMATHAEAGGWLSLQDAIPSLFLSLFSSQATGASRQEHLYKVLVIGDLGTGKTSIIKRYVHQYFSPHYRATVSYLVTVDSMCVKSC